VTDPSKAVFLSYASQDAEVAQRICEALRAGGIEVFLDRSELRGGDAWDQKIRHEIHDCALFVPIISQHTQERLEGYFRHEWKLAIERTHHMAEQKPFLVPVVIDGTGDTEAFVPDAFRAVQWTRLAGGETPPAFVEGIKRLLSPELSPMSAVSGPTGAIREPVRTSRGLKPVPLAIIALVVFAILSVVVIDRFWVSKRVATSAAFSPPPHSIAVLPFANMSGEKDQEYFSDGLTEELLNSLSEINELQVAARTSAFSFKGTNPDIGTIARKLNVGAVLEGSVRRPGNTVRVTTQLINAVTGFHVWSHTYDRDLGDLLKLETEIAGAVASALKVSLLGEVATRIEVGGTRNPAAFDAYLRARKANRSGDEQKAIAEFTEAIHLDPTFALAFAWRSLVYSNLGEAVPGLTSHQISERQESDARGAIKLAPELAEGYGALGRSAEKALDFTQAHEAYERALALAPGNATVLTMNSYFLSAMGHFDEAISAARRAVTLNPFNGSEQRGIGRRRHRARCGRHAQATSS
jgi:TolB-like protein